MTISRLNQRALGFAGAITLLAGCAGGTQSALTTGAISNAGGNAATAARTLVSPTAIRGAVRTTKSQGRSWSNVDPKRRTSLLYVTNTGTGTVNFYTYQNGRGSLQLQGQLTGFTYPGQPCVDAAGNVYIPDYLANQTVEYAHGGTTALRTLSAGGTGCSVDIGRTGNLAVAQFGLGDVAVFANGSTGPSTYSWPTTPYPEYVAYDASSDLFVAGQAAPSGGGDVLGVLTNGGSSITDLSLSGFSVRFCGQIQWGGTYLLVGDQEGPSTYQTTYSGSTLTFVRDLIFPGVPSGGVITGYWKTGNPPNGRVAAADYNDSIIQVDNFPSMTNLANITDQVSAPFGVVVSR